MKLRLKTNVKFGSNHRLDKGTEVESDENGSFPDYVNDNRSLFEEVAGSTPAKEASASPSGIVNVPAKPESSKKDMPVVKPKAEQSTTTEKVNPVNPVKPAAKAKPAKKIVKRNKA